MVLVKILGIIDLLAAILFLLIIFGINPFTPLVVFCAGILFLKGLMIFTGEIPLSMIDLFSSIILVLALYFNIPLVLIWIPAFLLMAKGMVSFM